MEDPTRQDGSARPLYPILYDEEMQPFLDASRQFGGRGGYRPSDRLLARLG